MMGAHHGQPFRDFALQLVQMGYPVLPIVPGQKRPMVPHWDSLNVDVGQVQQWLQQFPDANIGIRLGEATGTGYLVAVDLDIRDPDLLREWLQQISWLSLPARQGEPPKTLLLAQTDEPTTKLQSSVYEDGQGQTHRVEVLARGQQFVAFGTHPSGSTFQWQQDENAPLTVAASQLPVLTLDQLQAGVQLFEELASLRGWTAKTDSRAEIIPLDPQYREPMGANPEDIRKALAYLDSDEYFTWVDVGQALYHEFNGEETGFQLWDEWSSSSEKYPENHEIMREKWNSFRGIGTRHTITIRSVFYRAKQEYLNQQRGEQQRKANKLEPKPVTRIDPAAIPPRRWILGRRLMAHYLTATYAPGGVAKSILSLTSAISVATGYNLTGESVHQPGRVWVINNEDDEAELDRRLAGIMALHGVSDSELSGQLFVNSGYGEPVLIASEEHGLVVNHPNVEAIIEGIKEHNISYLVLDPFVSAHNSDENSNTAVNRVADAFKHIAAETGCAVEIIHHTRKGNMGDPGWHIGDAEAGRGASALKDSARIVTTLARIGQDQAQELGIPWEEGRRLVRMDLGKGNFSLPDEEATWFRLESVQLMNGDTVGVPTPYDIHAATQTQGIEHTAAKTAEARQWQIDIVEAMDQNEASVRLLQAKLEWVWEIGSHQAWRRITAATPVGEDQAAVVATQDGAWHLWLEGADRSPIVHRREFDAPWLL